MRLCCSAAALLSFFPLAAAVDTTAAISKLEKMCEHPDDFKSDQLEDAAIETEQAIRTHADSLHSPRVYVGDMWDVAHRLASRHPKLSLRFARDALRYIDQNWPSSDINEAERYRIWSAMLEAYVTAKDWDPALRLGETLLHSVGIGAPGDMFSSPALADIHLQYGTALAAVGRRLEAADQRRIAAGDRTPMMKVQAPGFLLQDLNGHSVGANDFEGQPRVIVFWATWCKPCHAEMEALKDIRLPAAVLTVATDSSPDEVLTFVRERGYKYPVLLSDHKVDQAYEVEALPKTFVIDEAGYIRSMRQGSDRDLVKHLTADLDAIKTRR